MDAFADVGVVEIIARTFTSIKETDLVVESSLDDKEAVFIDQCVHEIGYDLIVLW